MRWLPGWKCRWAAGHTGHVSAAKRDITQDTPEALVWQSVREIFRPTTGVYQWCVYSQGNGTLQHLPISVFIRGGGLRTVCTSLFWAYLAAISNGSLELALEIGKYLDYCGAKRAPLEPFSSFSLVEHATLEEKHHFLRSPTSPTSFLPIWRHPALSCRGSQVQICVKPCGASVFSLCLRAEDSFLTMTAGFRKHAYQTNAAAQTHRHSCNSCIITTTNH